MASKKVKQTVDEPIDDGTDTPTEEPTEGGLKEVISNFKPSADFSVSMSYGNGIMIDHEPISSNPKLGKFVSALREAAQDRDWITSQWTNTQLQINGIPGNYSNDDLKTLMGAIVTAAETQFELKGAMRDMEPVPAVDFMPNVLVGKAYLSPQQKVIQQAR